MSIRCLTEHLALARRPFRSAPPDRKRQFGIIPVGRRTHEGAGRTYWIDTMNEIE
ncbi:MAG: hypothetical protein QHG99_06355 [Methanomicrobiales archaeon]|nr:hypothetical protein [Methanomicrobiales archaeon]